MVKFSLEIFLKMVGISALDLKKQKKNMKLTTNQMSQLVIKIIVIVLKTIQYLITWIILISKYFSRSLYKL